MSVECNNVTLNVFGAGRSGTHCIVDWLSSLFDSPQFVKIDMCPRTYEVPFFEASAFKPKYNKVRDELQKLFKSKYNPQYNPKYNKVRDERQKLCLFQFNTTTFKLQKIRKCQFFMCDPEYRGIELCQDKMFGTSIKKLNILILRSPYNYIASRLKLAKRINKPIPINDIIDLWLTDANEFIGKTNYIGEKILIKYDNWFSDRGYRIDICKNVGGIYSEKTLNIVVNLSGGSSFNGMSFNGKAQKMAALDRYEVYVNDSEFREKVINNDEIKILSDKIFKDISFNFDQ